MTKSHVIANSSGKRMEGLDTDVTVNLFAITGSIITLAARTAQTPGEVASTTRDRLVALS